MNIANSLEQIRKHPKLYLGDVEPNGILLAARLAESALISGALLVELRVLDAGWMAVSAESDWIPKSFVAPVQRCPQGLVSRHSCTATSR
jgi:hypothetical protein